MSILVVLQLINNIQARIQIMIQFEFWLIKNVFLNL